MEEQKLAPLSEYHSKYCCYVKTVNFVAPVSDKPEGKQQTEGGAKKEKKGKKE